MNEESFRNHVNVHTKKGQFHCDNCNKNMGSRRAYNKHMKIQHGEKLNLPCIFCKKVFHERGNLQQHQAICAQNPDKKEYMYELCGIAVFNLHEKLMQHKREDIDGLRKMWMMKMMIEMNFQ